VVPRLRGPARSRNPAEILQEVRDLVAKGCSQVTFLGQNVNAYRDGSNGFAELLCLADRIDGLKRIRFVTSHPKDMDENILTAMADSSKVCEHLHLPLQSGSNGILQAMRRGYTAEQYEDLVARARRLLPGLSITTDIIAGFPGETEKDFEDTLDLMKRIEFDHAFTFNYSPRKGTEAAGMPDQVPPEIRQRRLERLIALRRQMTHDLLLRLVGQQVEVLVEGRSKRKAGELLGRTRTHRPVVFPGPVDLVGQLCVVDVKRAGGGTAWGEIDHSAKHEE
jgi:tRNA-2-methylthio-N6-dimethylallyladenosine synthase